MVKEIIPLEIMNEITSKCYDSHQELITEANKAHLKAVKQAINVRVGLPVGVLSVLLMWLITTTYSVGVSTAAHRASIDRTIETQTLTIGAEIETRKMSDDQLREELKRLEDEIKSNFNWLIENGNFNKRGENPLIMK